MGRELWHNELADDTSAACSNEEVIVKRVQNL